MATSASLTPILCEDEVDLDSPGFELNSIRSVSLSSNTTISGLLRKASNYKVHHQEQAYRQHQLMKTSFYKPTHCQSCGDMIWGIHKQGFNCMVCNFRCHERCRESVVVPCLTMKLAELRKPNSHWFKLITPNKRVYCNVCRHKITSSCLRCEVCKYYSHSQCMHEAVLDCLDSSTHNEYSGSMLDTNLNSHHWVEGNLPASARCTICDKSCGHPDCLMDVRCVRCGILVHTYCLPIVKAACNIGLLKSMFLSPTIVTVMLRGDDAVTPIQGTKTENRFCPSHEVPPLIVPDEGLDSLHLDEGDTLEASSIFEEIALPNRLIKVWDYTRDDNLSGKQSKTIKIYENQTASDVVNMVLKKFRLFGYPANFYLVIPASPEDQVPEDEVLSPEVPIFSIPSRREHIIVHLKFKKDEGETYALKMYTKIKLADAETATIYIKPGMTVQTVIKEAVKDFHVLTGTLALCECYIDKYLCQGSIFHLERLENDEDIWEVTAEDRRSCFNRARFTRYFLKKHLNEEFNVVITNLPVSKTEEEYKAMLISEQLQDKVQLEAMMDIHGVVVLKCDGDRTVDDLCVELSIANQKPCTLVLPTLQTTSLKNDIKPLLVFVNSRSGGGQGKELISGLRRHLNPHQIFDLTHGGPYPGIFTFRNFEQFRVLICGGDGTYGWVLQALDETQTWRKCAKPECALLPLGTGNDLARAFGWGAGYSGEKAVEVLCKMNSCYPIQFDRWTMVFDSRKNSIGGTLMEQNKLIVMNNYFGIGIDAEVSLAFHEAREKHPEKFSSRIYNKFQYAKLGAELMIENQAYNLRRDLEIQVDGETIDFPPNIVGIVVLNINSWAAGGDAWGCATDPKFQNQDMGDGKLEVAGVTGSIHMVQIQKGLGHAIRLAQGAHIKLSTKVAFPVQVDGEPWRQPAGHIAIFPQMEKSTLLMHVPERRTPKIQKSVSADVYMV
ncbi:Diacylglycerol kinase theta-like [Oopsacas minuta]|uniref:Diacylglycerol kinase n=1 Tax=Oopsacas minuta TaxID=111878 RepID=A0AAV7K6T3_9METZ|nr:Diacylglycerol kinase theta-like [Oopsacas minuta]